MKKELLALAALFILILGVGWALSHIRPATVSPSPLPREVNLEAFKQIVSGKSAVILDARSADFFVQGHVPGALNLPLFDFNMAEGHHPLLDKIPKNQQIVIYCSNPHCHDSANLADGLSQLGYTHLSVFKDGITAWKDAKLPTETQP